MEGGEAEERRKRRCSPTLPLLLLLLLLSLNKFHWRLVNFYFCGAAAAAFLAAGPICRPAARCLGGGGGGMCVCVCMKG